MKIVDIFPASFLSMEVSDMSLHYIVIKCLTFDIAVWVTGLNFRNHSIIFDLKLGKGFQQLWSLNTSAILYYVYEATFSLSIMNQNICEIWKILKTLYILQYQTSRQDLNTQKLTYPFH